MLAPLLSDDKLLGVMVAVSQRRDRRYKEEDLRRFTELAPHAMMAKLLIQNYAESSKQERLDQELDFARQLQSGMLPPPKANWGPFSLQAFTCSAKEVNGDFYDFVQIDEDRMLVVIGDACGKGVPACMLTAMTRSYIRAAAANFTDLEFFLREINRNLHQESEADRFVSLACCIFDRRNSIMEVARAGHTELLTFVRGHIRRINPEGAVLGLLPDELVVFDTMCMEFNGNMALLLYSDGITEALSKEGEEFGIERLEQLFRSTQERHEPPIEACNTILAAVGKFAETQIDDQTLLLVKHL